MLQTQVGLQPLEMENFYYEAEGRVRDTTFAGEIDIFCTPLPPAAR